MSDAIIYEDSQTVIYDTESPILFSATTENKLGLGVTWRPWKPYILQVREDATIVTRKARGTPVKRKYDVKSVTITLMESNIANAVIATNSLIKKEVGIMVKCIDINDLDTYFRCILTEEELQKFSDALQIAAHEYDAKDTINIIHHDHTIKGNEVLGGTANSSNSQLFSVIKSAPIAHKITNQSIMRRSVAMEMDKFDKRSKIERIRARRGSFKSLPVYFSNDLVHGSWWFTAGSVVYAVTSLVVFINSYFPEMLGDDDSTLSPFRFRASWLLMILSGVSFTLGSLAFIRAMHDDPPMRALFPNVYHVQSDELLGSWLFLFGTVIFIPYCMIFVAGTSSKLLYLGLLAVAFIVSVGTYLFVRACYPTEEEQMKIIKPISRVMCFCCLSRNWMKKHMPNDWLAGAWFIYWAMVFATVASFVILLYTIVYASLVNKFVMGCGVFSNICFLFGAVYFVSGSYPEKRIFNEEDDGEEIVPKEITSSANDPHTSNHIGKFLQSAISSKPSSTNGKSSEELGGGGGAISGRGDRDRDRDIESLNVPFISTVDNSF